MDGKHVRTKSLTNMYVLSHWCENMSVCWDWSPDTISCNPIVSHQKPYWGLELYPLYNL